MKNSPLNATRRRIRPLPERLVNKIAAGEVIERPAAVLKELVENSIDAESTQIDIVVEKSGTKLISVTDNGGGIEPEQVEIAFSRHATSKISDFADLDQLRSYGFRGEALPSIASISRTIMITKTAMAEGGMKLIIEGGVVQSLKPVSAPNGTKVEVENLFFNTPARRKFLKAETTEARHLTRNAIALALGAANVRFSYSLNGRKVFALDESHSDEKIRTGHILFGDRNFDLYEIISASDSLKIRGFLSQTQDCRQNQYGLYLFINGRYIKSQTLVHAITSGYGELLPRGHYPAGTVFLEIDPLKVDVNVHPTKAEVRLSDEKLIHDLLYQAAKKGTRGAGQFSSAGLLNKNDDAPAVSSHGNFSPRHYEKPGINEASKITQSELKEIYDWRPTGTIESNRINDIDSKKSVIPDSIIEHSRSSKKNSDVNFLGQFGELYLIFNSGNEVIIIDQHTAHERVLFEETLKIIGSGNGVAQSLLFPINIELTVERSALFDEAAEILKSIGFEVEPFGSGNILLSAVPSILAKKSPEKIFLGILDDIELLHRTEDDLIKRIAQSIACRAAVMAGDKIGSQEATALFYRLMQCENGQSCPHGRPTVLKISKDELNARFGRK